MLRGEVASEAERGQALLLARNSAGVQRVEDNLTVNATIGRPAATAPPAIAPANDATVTADVKSRLAADRQLRSVVVGVKDGSVELRGTVPSATARQRALDVARQSSGVTQVVDRLRIKR